MATRGTTWKTRGPRTNARSARFSNRRRAKGSALVRDEVIETYSLAKLWTSLRSQVRLSRDAIK